MVSLVAGQESDGFPVALDGKFYYDINSAINHAYSFKEEDKTQNLMLKLSLQKVLEENKFYAGAAKKALLALLDLREKGGYAPTPFLFFLKIPHPLIKHVRLELKKWTPKRIMEVDFRNAVVRSRLLEDELTSVLMAIRRRGGGLSGLYEQSQENEQRLREEVLQLNEELGKRNSSSDFETVILSCDQKVATLTATFKKEIGDLRHDMEEEKEEARKKTESLEQKLEKAEVKNQKLQDEIDFLKAQNESGQKGRKNNRYGSGAK